jgi:hypothetical protein
MPKMCKLYKDKDKLLITRNKQRKLNYRIGRKYQTHRDAYTEDELLLLESHYTSDRDLAKRLGRSVAGIQIKRCRVKKLQNKEV